MKKHAIIFSLIFTVFVFASCGLKGGTIEVKNDSTYTASIVVNKGSVPVTDLKKADPGKTVTFSIVEDGTYIIDAAFFSGTTPKGHGSGTAVLSGGTTKTVTVKPD